MKLGYLYVPPSGSLAAASDARDTGRDMGRAMLARSLGFCEFYAPTVQAPVQAPVRALPGPEAHPVLQILTGSPSAPGPQLAYADQAVRNGQTCSPPPLTAPLASADVVYDPSRAGHLPFSVSWLGVDQLSRHWAAHVTGCTHAARKASLIDWRVARSVMINDDAALAEALVKAPDSPCRAYYASVLGSGADTAAIDALIDACVLFGDPATVSDKLARLRQEAAAFGTLVYVDHAWPDAARARASMSLLADMVHQGFDDTIQPGPWLAMA